MGLIRLREPSGGRKEKQLAGAETDDARRYDAEGSAPPARRRAAILNFRSLESSRGREKREIIILLGIPK